MQVLSVGEVDQAVACPLRDRGAVFVVTYAVAGMQRVAEVPCYRLVRQCPTGSVDVWVDRADAETIVISGGHLSLQNGWRYWLAALGIPATLFGILISIKLRSRPMTNEPVTPQPCKPPPKAEMS